MPALVNRRVGSFAGTSEEERTMRCPRVAKKSRKRCLVSWPVTGSPSGEGVSFIVASRELGGAPNAEARRGGGWETRVAADLGGGGAGWFEGLIAGLFEVFGGRRA